MNSHSSKPKKLLKSSRPIRFSRILRTTQQSIENISEQFKRNKAQDNYCFSYKFLRTFNDKSSSTLVFLLKNLRWNLNIELERTVFDQQFPPVRWYYSVHSVLKTAGQK